MLHARKFKSGNSIALRIPHELKDFFSGSDYKIFRRKDQIIVEKINDNWENIFANCYNPDFPDREDMKFSERESLD